MTQFHVMIEIGFLINVSCIEICFLINVCIGVAIEPFSVDEYIMIDITCSLRSFAAVISFYFIMENNADST